MAWSVHRGAAVQIHHEQSFQLTGTGLVFAFFLTFFTSLAGGLIFFLFICLAAADCGSFNFLPTETVYKKITNHSSSLLSKTVHIIA